MAVAVVALTLLYFAGSKIKNQIGDSQNPVSIKVESGPASKHQDPPEKRSRLKITNLLPKRKTTTPQPDKPPVEKDIAISKPDTVEKLPLPKEGPSSQTEINKAEVPLKNQPAEANHAAVQPAPVVNQPVAEPPPQIINVVYGAPVAPPTNAPVQEKPNSEPMKNIEVKEMKIETRATPDTPANQTDKDKPVKTEVENITKNSGSAGDFSELFTQDEEETEVSRLAKELEEVDSVDILEESRDLISQFKRVKN